MHLRFPLLLILLSLSIPSLGETWGDLVEREGLFYKKFTDVPFTGEVAGLQEGFLKDGKRQGSWAFHHRKGQLEKKGAWKDGKEEGPWVFYHPNGQVYLKVAFKDGKEEGLWVEYRDNGELSFWVEYKDGKREGPYVDYDVYGNKYSGIYKNGEKISD